MAHRDDSRTSTGEINRELLYWTDDCCFVHVHIIPRYNSKETIWTKRNIPNVNDLEKLAEEIRKCIINYL